MKIFQIRNFLLSWLVFKGQGIFEVLKKRTKNDLKIRSQRLDDFVNVGAFIQTCTISNSRIRLLRINGHQSGERVVIDLRREYAVNTACDLELVSCILVADTMRLFFALVEH